MGALDRIFRRRASSQQTIEAQVQNIIRAAAVQHQCVWYDPSDLSTMFQDSAGTTPVTAVEQSVGLILDKSKGLALGPELVANGDFSSGIAGWTVNNVGQVVAASGGASFVNAPDVTTIYQALSAQGRRFQVTYTVVSISSGAVTARVGGQNGTPRTAPGTYTDTLTGYTSPNVGIVSVGASTNALVDNVSVRELPGNHASQATTGYKPVLKQDANGCYYLKFDGSDDFLSTANIDFSTTDKVAVAAGVRKLSDAAAGMLCELSATVANAGAFNITAPPSVAPRFGCASKGTILTGADISVGVAAPISAIVSATSDIGADALALRVSGVQKAISTGDQGAGNFGNYPLYIGRRGGLTNPFNGHLYGLCVIGGLDDITKLRKIERLLAKKTGVTV